MTIFDRRQSMTENESTQQQTKSHRLNQHCTCVTLDWSAIIRDLNDQLGANNDDILPASAMHQFFSNAAIFIPDSDLDEMQVIVKAIEAAASLAGYQQQVMSWAPESARHNPGPLGAFMGYDFHLSENGPRLIEINTNAGGAFLNAILARAQLKCCSGTTQASWAKDFDEAVIAQFKSEWRAQRGKGQPERIAIIDDTPEEQHLYPEFKLAQQLFIKHGIDAVILSPKDLKYESGSLSGNNQHIDMVYNRLVDFGLDAPEHAALRSAWLEDGAVITPNPHTHALFANKRNLVLLSDQQMLIDWGLSSENAELLKKGVPRTIQVTAHDEQLLWQQRRQWFFKPMAGHGSKGVYSGSKLTKSTFSRILESDYVAQAYVPPSERVVMIDDVREMLKVDVRLYTYRGALLLAAARLYRGQATNLRTPGGGFAPLLFQQS